MKNGVITAISAVLSCSVSSCGCSDTDISGGDAVVFADGPWDPPIDSLGESGWRESIDPWCSGAPITMGAFDIWSDSSGVYLLGEYYYVDEHAATVGCPSEHCYGYIGIFNNHGSGWETYWTREEIDGFDPDDSWLSGIPSGPLLLVERSVYCEFNLVWPGAVECALPDGSRVQDIFTVNNTLAYAIKDDKVIYWDGSEWGPYPAAYTPYLVTKIWADEDDIVCVGPDGIAVTLEGEEWVVHDTGTLRGLDAIWGFEGNDIWVAGGPTGLMHYDGVEWIEVDWPNLVDTSNPCMIGKIKEFWGQEGILYFHTGHQLVMWDGVSFRTIAFWPADTSETDDTIECSYNIQISSMWGNSPDELFLAVKDHSHVTEDCNMDYLLWWDGASFHWF